MSESKNLSDLLADAIAAAAPGVAFLEGRCVGGSASVWSADGVLITALHTLGPAESVNVTLHDGRTLSARVVGRDAGTDLAVLRVDANDLTPLAWDEGADLRVGNLVTPLGRPYGGIRATLGMVASLRDAIRTAQGGTLDAHIDVDGSLPRGFSGGPLLGPRGAALGMNTAALVRGGVTVPTRTLRRVIPALLADGNLGRGYLGVGVHPVRVPEAVAAQAPQRWGLMTVSLEPEGPAAAGGLHVGDVILSVDGVAVQHPGDLVSQLTGRGAQTVTVRVARAGAVVELSVTAGRRGA
ncbi:MAG: trypsin-like peptidase domain-containing protein [Polyangiales bacterium]